jgi:hypothetical protein
MFNENWMKHVALIMDEICWMKHGCTMDEICQMEH